MVAVPGGCSLQVEAFPFAGVGHCDCWIGREFGLWRIETLHEEHCLPLLEIVLLESGQAAMDGLLVAAEGERLEGDDAYSWLSVVIDGL